MALFVWQCWEFLQEVLLRDMGKAQSFFFSILDRAMGVHLLKYPLHVGFRFGLAWLAEDCPNPLPFLVSALMLEMDENERPFALPEITCDLLAVPLCLTHEV